MRGRRLGPVLLVLLLAACAPRVPVSLPAPPPPLPPVPAAPAPVDFVLVEKAERRLTLYAAGRPVYVVRGIQLGDVPVGPKRFEGDERTPEGRFTLDYRNPASAYHLSLHISYPRPQDRAAAAAEGRSPGGQIFIHGQPNDLAAGRIPGDWTDGCIAVDNVEIKALWDAVADGTPIEIRP